MLEDCCTVEELHLALTHVAEAQAAIAPDQTAIYQTLSTHTDLDVSALLTLLGELGFRLSVTPKEKVA